MGAKKTPAEIAEDIDKFYGANAVGNDLPIVVDRFVTKAGYEGEEAKELKGRVRPIFINLRKTLRVA